MGAVYTDAEPVKAIAEELIREHHERILDHRVRMVYLFSDQEPETKGKRKLGDLKIITNLNAHIAEKPEAEEYELPSFVCGKCRGWKVASEMAELEVNADTFTLCQVCYDEICEWDWSNNGNIAKLVNWREMAKMKYDGGYNSGDCTAFFVMVVYKTFFDMASAKAKQAIINHLLCHAGVTTDKHGDTKLYMKPHDVEEFTENVKLFGVDWLGELGRFAEQVIKHKSPQLELISLDDNERIMPLHLRPQDSGDGAAPEGADDADHGPFDTAPIATPETTREVGRRAGRRAKEASAV